MINAELLADIRETAGSNCLVEIARPDSSALISKCSDLFVLPSAGRWWWQRLRTESATIRYGDGDGLKIVVGLVGAQKPVVLVPTDDEPPPWTAFTGDCESIVRTLSDLQYFEYFLTDLEGSWLVFDTHHNELVVTGTLIEEARKLNSVDTRG